MISLYFIIGFSFFTVCILVALFVWAVRSGQWNDLETPAQRILTEELDEKR